MSLTPKTVGSPGGSASSTASFVDELYFVQMDQFSKSGTNGLKNVAHVGLCIHKPNGQKLSPFLAEFVIWDQEDPVMNHAVSTFISVFNEKVGEPGVWVYNQSSRQNTEVSIRIENKNTYCTAWLHGRTYPLDVKTLYYQS